MPCWNPKNRAPRTEVQAGEARALCCALCSARRSSSVLCTCPALCSCLRCSVHMRARAGTAAPHACVLHVSERRRHHPVALLNVITAPTNPRVNEGQAQSARAKMRARARGLLTLLAPRVSAHVLVHAPVAHGRAHACTVAQQRSHMPALTQLMQRARMHARAHTCAALVFALQGEIRRAPLAAHAPRVRFALRCSPLLRSTPLCSAMFCCALLCSLHILPIQLFPICPFLLSSQARGHAHIHTHTHVNTHTHTLTHTHTA